MGSQRVAGLRGPRHASVTRPPTRGFRSPYQSPPGRRRVLFNGGRDNPRGIKRRLRCDRPRVPEVKKLPGTRRSPEWAVRDTSTTTRPRAPPIEPFFSASRREGQPRGRCLTERREMGLANKWKARAKQVVGDLTGSAATRREGQREERSAAATEEAARAEEHAEAKRREASGLKSDEGRGEPPRH